MGLIIGADLAIRHGALVDINGNLLHSYKNELGMMSSFTDLFDIAETSYHATPIGAIIAIDFDRTLGSWNRNPEQGILLTMLVAFYGALCHATCDVHYVTPSLVRSCLGLPRTAHKSEVHHAVKDLVPKGLYKDSKGDNIDSWVLAWTYECSGKAWRQ
jgi:hypothetical protein